MWLRLSLTIALLTLSCSRTEPPSQTARASTAPEPVTSATPNSSSTHRDQPIRSVDFCRVGFPNYPEYVGDRGKKKYITLKFEPACGIEPTYGDVTGDGLEEAMIFLGIETRGSATPGIAYIFGLLNGRPGVLWSFETGDRADGGYQNVYGERGELVVELEGKNKVIGKSLYGGDDTSNGLCCPTFFTRTRYRWNGSRFVQNGEPENVPIPGAVKTNGAT